MGELVEFELRAAQACGEEDTTEFEAFLATEGLALLAEFRSINDAAVRASMMQMISKVAAALRSDEVVPAPLPEN